MAAFTTYIGKTISTGSSGRTQKVGAVFPPPREQSFQRRLSWPDTARRHRFSGDHSGPITQKSIGWWQRATRPYFSDMGFPTYISIWPLRNSGIADVVLRWLLISRTIVR